MSVTKCWYKYMIMGWPTEWCRCCDCRVETECVSICLVILPSVYTRSALFWDLKQCRLGIPYRSFNTTYFIVLLGPWIWRPIGCTETSVFRCVRFQKSADLICTSAESWHHADILQSNSLWLNFYYYGKILRQKLFLSQSSLKADTDCVPETCCFV
jgi:hypothetical protein